MIDFTARRTMMVDTQVRPSDVTKFPIIEAMLSVPREVFVPEDRREAAYMGDHLGLGGCRVVMDPRTLAKLLDALDIQPDETVLDLGCAYGYSSAVIARMAGSVTAVEEDADLAATAGQRLAAQGVTNVTVIAGKLCEGAAKAGPFDVIILQGAAESVPAALLAQLKEGGRIGCIFMEAALGVARIGYKIDGQVNWRNAFNASAPVLPGFAAKRAFTL